jgi:hypothetical protein
VSYSVRVPRGTVVTAVSDSGAVTVRAVAGAVTIRTQSAAIEWCVTLPEYPAGQCWSKHETQAEAEGEAHSVAADMGYDGVTVQS